MEFFDAVQGFFASVDDFMYFPILVIVLAAAGLFFTVRTGAVQIRRFGTACKLIVEKPASEQKVPFSSPQRWCCSLSPRLSATFTMLTTRLRTSTKSALRPSAL